jgi:hypothetical protein
MLYLMNAISLPEREFQLSLASSTVAKTEAKQLSNLFMIVAFMGQYAGEFIEIELSKFESAEQNQHWHIYKNKGSLLIPSVSWTRLDSDSRRSLLQF